MRFFERQFFYAPSANGVLKNAQTIENDLSLKFQCLAPRYKPASASLT